ncbi:MAG: carbohydrate ABC transporter permease [bacterium]|nr:carbohydrate ABC transporter permease [bacterium]
MVNTRRNGWSVAADAMAIGLALLWLAPLIFGLLMSFRPQAAPISSGNIFFGCQSDLSDQQQALIDEREAGRSITFAGCTVTRSNYDAAWSLTNGQWPRFFLNSLIFVVGTLAVQVVTVTMAAYAFARMRFFGRNVLLFALLLQLMVPTGLLIIQNFATIRRFGLLDTHWALMLPYWGSAFGVLLLRQTFRQVPYELEEAARIDGANLAQVLTNVYMPLSVPAYIAFALVSISSHWNEVLWPLIVTRTDTARTLTVGLSLLYENSDTGANYGLIMAGTILVVAPLVGMFMLFQRRFIESFASSGIK